MTNEEMSTMDLTTPVEITPGQFKPLGDCTAEDLTAAADLARATAEMQSAAAEELQAVARELPSDEQDDPDGSQRP